MPLLRAQVCLAADSSIPADIAINTFHFDAQPTGLPLAPTLEQLVTGERDGSPDERGMNGDLSDLYNDISDHLSSAIDPSNSRIKWYNLDTPAPRFPFLELPMDSFITTSTSALPSELAIVSSFQADPVQGVNQARRRNRVYLGPLGGNTINTTDGRIGSLATGIIKDAFVNLAQNSNGALSWAWVIYSPTSGVYTAVDSGWVDNAFDIQRRRGIEATIRNTWEESA